MKRKSAIFPAVLFILCKLSSMFFSAFVPSSDYSPGRGPGNEVVYNSLNEPEAPQPAYSGGLGLLIAKSAESGKTLSEPFEECSFDKDVIITLSFNDQLISMPLNEYLIGVIAAEMPASFNIEALKAQAVACRSCTLYNMKMARPKVHPEADVCSNSACCQAYNSLDEMKAKWGEKYDQYYSIILNAVEETDGICLSYSGDLIYAPYHSSSDGQTESSKAVWSDKPYLVGVYTPESQEEVPNFITTVTLTKYDFMEAVREQYPDICEEPKLIQSIQYSDSGRIKCINAGGIEITGTELRRIFSLRSTKIELFETDDTITFTIYGWGHGVGMSQYGANVFAEQGLCYDEILKRYYTGIEIIHLGKEE